MRVAKPGLMVFAHLMSSTRAQGKKRVDRKQRKRGDDDEAKPERIVRRIWKHQWHYANS
jgi:hypothetical protein